MADPVAKRKDDEELASVSGPPSPKRSKVLTAGGANTPELPLTFYKELLKRTLPKVKIVEDNSKSPSPGKKPARVFQDSIGEDITAVMDSLEDRQMRLTLHGKADETPVSSEFSSNTFMAKHVFHPINEILSQSPNKFNRRWCLLENPHKSKRKDIDERWCNVESSKDAPDVRLQLCYTEEGELKPEPVAAVELEGKVPSVFKSQSDPSIMETGQLLLGQAYKDGSLSPEGVHAFEQAFRYLDNMEHTESMILFTPAVLWVLTYVNRARRNVSVSEPFTANCQNPSMKEVVFATVIRELAAAQSRMEGTPNWVQEMLNAKMDEAERRKKEKSAQREREAEKAMEIKWRKEELATLWAQEAELETELAKVRARKAELETELEKLEVNDEEPRAGCEYSGGLGAQATAPHGCKTLGDDLLHELDDAQPAISGNSLVRIGRVKGCKVAAKIVSGDAEDWVKEEIENEGRKLDAFRPLQGKVVPEKIYFGKCNEGKDWLLVTKFVDGNSIDKVPVTERVAQNARSALQEIHNQGFVHGDVMPRNVFVTKAGDCVLLDLGRTKLSETEKDKQNELSALERWLI